MSTSEVSSDVDEPDDRHHQCSDSLNSADDCEDNDNLSLSQRRIIKQVPLNRVARMSTMDPGTSLPHESPPSCKQQHKSSQSQRGSSLLNVESATAEVEAEKSKKLLEWELSSLEADDLRSHAWYHGHQVDRTEAERLLRQCVAEEYGSATNFIITSNDTVSVSPPIDATTATNCCSSLQQNVEEASDSDLSSDSSDEDLGITDFMDERGLVVPHSKTKSTEMGGVLLKRRLGPHRPRRHFYCFLVRDSLNVRPPGRYVLSCLRVDKYEDNETWDKNKYQLYPDEQRRKYRRKQQRRQQRQLRHPVLHFVVNEIILQPGTVYERSQFSFGETLPSMTTDISTAVVNNNDQRQPGFDSVPDLIRYYVGGADDNAVLLYGGGHFGAVSTCGRTFSRIAQIEVRLRYPCNRRRPLITDYSLVEAAFPNILQSTVENSRLIRQRCRTLTADSVCTEELRALSASLSKEIEASTSSQNKNHRHHSPSPPPQTSKWIRMQSSSRSSIRRIPSATVTSGMATSAASSKPSSAGGSANQIQSQPLSKSPCPPRIDPQSPITESISVSPNLSAKTLPRQPKSSYPLLSTSGSSSSLSSERPSTSGSKSIYPDMPSRSTPLTISDLLSSSPPSSVNPRRLSWSTSRTNSLNREGVQLSPSRSPSLEIRFYDRYEEDSYSSPFDTAVSSSFVQRRPTPNLYRFEQDPKPLYILGEDRYYPEDSELPAMFVDRSPSPQIQPDKPQDLNNIQNALSSSRNKNDGIDKKGEQRFSSSDSSSISTYTLKDEEIEHKRGGQLTDNQKVEHAVEQPQQNKHQFADRQVLNSQREIQDEEMLEAENPMKNVEVRQKSVEEKLTIDDTKVYRKENDKLRSSDLELNVEKSSKASGNQNFQKCRTRLSNTMRQGLAGMLKQPHLDQQDRQLTRITTIRDCDPRQRRLRQMHQTLIENQEVGYTTDSIKMESRKIIPDIETIKLARLTNCTDRAATVAPAQIRATRKSIWSSNNDLAENMVRQWAGLQKISNLGRNSKVTEVYHRSQIHLIELLPRIRRDRQQNNRPVTVSGNRHFGKPLRGHATPSGETQLRVNCPQVNMEITGNNIINHECDDTPVTKAGQSNTTAIFSDIYCPLTRIIPSTTIESSASTSVQEISSVDVGSIACDYVNINSQKDNHQNLFDKNDTRNFNTNNSDRTHHKNYQHHGYKHQVSKPQSNNNHNSVVDNNEPVADYENIHSHNIDDTNDFNYENISQNNDEKRQQLINDCNRSNTAVAAALRAVHLAIIGDPDDSGGVTLGTGKLAAALCRADGRVTVLPYRRNVTKSKQVGPLLSTCPLQLLGQPGPAGRRARLDVIERFACLQYLVAMTVIVTPCLMLIGSDINDKENLADKNLEWSLEDEYEYRRRRFYYRCAGISSLCVSDNYSTSDDDDEESYRLTANSDFDSGYSLPPREEWAVEKRHWWDLLTKHRAAALDKWIRTAADAKQAVGDVYGYRALMSALCSDRIQSLQDAWMTLRQLHTATAVAFESRLRPEFLGRREKNLATVSGKSGINDIDDNDVNELLQLPPNATVPDATALAVLYEHLYNVDSSNTGSSINTTTTGSSEIDGKKELDPRISSFFTSPLLLSPSPWLSLNSGISGGLGSSIASDYGLSALHVQCIQYSEWVQQSYVNDDSILPLTKTPMLPLDRFRSNFRALLPQYSGSDFDVYDDGDEGFNYVLDYKDENFQKNGNTSYHKEINDKRNNDFEYERQYEDSVEEYDYDDCGDDDDDDATVICCNNSSLSAGRRIGVDTMCANSHVGATAGETQHQTTTKNEKCHRLQQNQENDQYYRWIEDVCAFSPGPAPLNIVFCTELHVCLFWPPTLFLQNINDDKDTVDNELAIPAYALGTTYLATETVAYENESESTNTASSALALNHVITAQLDQAAQDMRLRYKAMDDFLDKACSYSAFLAKVAHEDNMTVGK